MEILPNVILFSTGLVLLVLFSSFGILSLIEREKRASWISFGLAFLSIISLWMIWVLSPLAKVILLSALALISLTAVIIFLLPIGRIEIGNEVPRHRFDERDIVFARQRLKPGSQVYRSYYAMRPEKEQIDRHTRARPGLLSPASLYANPFHFASAEASFFLTEALREAVNGPVATERQELPVAQMTAYLKHLANYFGALAVGVTRLQTYHIYSHVGRGRGNFGDPIKIEHRYALAFTVEMDHKMVRSGPKATTTMESARQYVESARIAVQLASALRAMGYPARAHIDGNYQVIAPLVARDAGLGEIGRIGLLITPRSGPRVRLAVVTTEAELIPDGPRQDPSVIDFCTICKKCAENCPCQALPLGERVAVDGTLRWRVDAEKCYLYWNTIGTDCGRCLAVCPYSHPDNIFHLLIRQGIAHSGTFRRAALRLDDLFYGRKPPPHPVPGWTDI